MVTALGWYFEISASLPSSATDSVHINLASCLHIAISRGWQSFRFLFKQSAEGSNA